MVLLRGCSWLVLATACSPAQDETVNRPNVVIVTLDTTRADHLGCYGYFRDTSPELDRLAAESIVFERCITPMATTLPAHTSLFTGTHPIEHGVLANVHQGGRRFQSASGLETVGQVLAGAGYQTAAFISALPLKRGAGLSAGFEVWNEPDGSERAGKRSARAAVRWLRRRESPGPFFLWLHFYDPHYPLETPPGYEERFAPDEALRAHLGERRIEGREGKPADELFTGYDAEVFYQDEALGILLDALRTSGEWERTAVLVLSDHGEGLFQHDERSHGGTWDEQLRVPMVLRIPGRQPGRDPRPLSVMDAVPTLLSALDIEGTRGFLASASGVDVLATDEERLVLSLDTGRVRQAEYERKALTGRRWKYLVLAHSDGRLEEQLFDLESDPFELVDVASEQPDVVRGMRQELRAREALYAERSRSVAPPRGPEGDADPALLEALEALGYTGY